MTPEQGTQMTFGEHLDELRATLLRIIAVGGACAAVIFVFKDWVFAQLLAPASSTFVTYRAIERVISLYNPGFTFEPFSIRLIATDMASQFVAHISVSVCLGALLASPYILFELFRFVAPGLYSGERRMARILLVSVCLLFIIGVAASYFILFPVACRFLVTYSVSDLVTNTITLDSYISTFATLTLMMGVVFQLPVVTWALARGGMVTGRLLSARRREAILAIAIIAAIITPPDLMTLFLVGIPLVALYELSVFIARATAGE